MTVHLLIYLLSFVSIWIGSGIAIRAVQKLSRYLKISAFGISFLVLGFFTSISEFSVGINAVVEQDPEIFVGNLIGASIVLFMLLTPLLAIAGNSIKITSELRGYRLAATLLVIALPVLLAIDGQLNQFDSIMSMAAYIALLVIMPFRQELLEKIGTMTSRSSVAIGREIAKILTGVSIIFVASHFLVQQTTYFSDLIGISPFLISLLLIAIGTNVPEISLAVRSLIMKNKQVAFGDYAGSAAFNTFLFGLLTVVNGKTIYLSNSYLVSLLFLVVGLIVFYIFARSRYTISRLEGVGLLAVYVLFIAAEVILYTRFH
jgi:cation:H+ antiporter